VGVGYETGPTNPSHIGGVRLNDTKEKRRKKKEEKKTILASLRTLLPLLRRAWCSVCCDPLQDSIASVCGATASITVAAPLDVIKTRIQSGREGGKGGVQLIKELVRQEGLGGFFRGLWPKVRSSEAGTGEGEDVVENTRFSDCPCVDHTF